MFQDLAKVQGAGPQGCPRHGALPPGDGVSYGWEAPAIHREWLYEIDKSPSL